MVSIGRGRGWAQNYRTPSPTPGRSLSSEDTNFSDFVNLVSLVTEENCAEKIEELVKFIVEKVDKENLRDMHDKLYKRGLNDREFGLKLMIIHKFPIMKEVRDSNGRSLYINLVKHFEDDYKQRKEVQKENVEQFRNAICLFSKSLSYTVGSLNTYPKLQLALLNYMESLLQTPSEEDIQIFMEQMLLHGRVFQLDWSKKTNDLMTTVRKILLAENISVMSRKILLYTIDLANNNFNILPIDLQKFYKLELGDKFVQEYDDVIDTPPKIIDEQASTEDELSAYKYQSVLENIGDLKVINDLEATNIEK